ncbi:hypothetical protein COM83_14610 [Bacillus cereus]|nr:hypothetical protein COM83_14610 [Bacillus cereus]PFW14945.1 hypothetical protein COL18_16445 [Bacillus cereus]PGX03203.1 hypothetical protein COE40_13995 [Bacillus cereus]PGY19907.1 hypothetical protein COE16_15820 [Bacillus cereus]
MLKSISKKDKKMSYAELAFNRAECGATMANIWSPKEQVFEEARELAFFVLRNRCELAFWKTQPGVVDVILDRAADQMWVELQQFELEWYIPEHFEEWVYVKHKQEWKEFNEIVQPIRQIKYALYPLLNPDENEVKEDIKYYTEMEIDDMKEEQN